MGWRILRVADDPGTAQGQFPQGAADHEQPQRRDRRAKMSDDHASAGTSRGGLREGREVSSQASGLRRRQAVWRHQYGHRQSGHVRLPDERSRKTEDVCAKDAGRDRQETGRIHVECDAL